MPSLHSSKNNDQLDSSVGAGAFAVAAVSLGFAMQVNYGTFADEAMLALSAAFLVALFGICANRWIPLRGENLVVSIIALGCCLELAIQARSLPGISLQPTHSLSPYRTGLIVAAVLIGAGLPETPWLGKYRMPLLLSVYAFLGVWLIQASPRPFIDVYMFQENALEELLHGGNPYAMTFPDIHHDPLIYGPGIMQNGRLMMGFPYFPLSLLLAIPGHLAHDLRYSHLGAITLAGACIAYARPGRLAEAAAALFLFTPRGFFVLEQSWTEPFVTAAFGLVLFAACRFPRAVPWALGIFVAVKQYVILAAPAALLLFPKPISGRDLARTVAKAAAVAAAITLPFVLWNAPEFFKSAIGLQFNQPFRADSLSFLAWPIHLGSPRPWSGWCFVAVILAIGASLWLCPRTPSGFAAAVSFTFLAFFAFNKQAFCNYYFFVVGALCSAVGTANLKQTDSRI